MLLVTAGQMQAMDRKTIDSFGLPGLLLMENAGRGAFDFLLETFSAPVPGKVAVIAGRGNNGGDGFVIARYLMEKKIRVNIFLMSSKDRVTGDAAANMKLAETLCNCHSGCSIIEVPDADALEACRPQIFHSDLIVDALLGTGLNSDVRGFFKTAIQWMNESRAPVFSVDIPSGLNADTGRPMGIAVKADATATFAFAKSGHVLYPGNTYTGRLKIIDIGIPDFIAEQENIKFSMIEKHDIASMFRPRRFQDHKGSFGHVLVVAGSTGKTGAAALCANAAMRCGAGLVTLGAAKSINSTLEPMVMEPMTCPLPEDEKGFLAEHSFKTIEKIAQGKQVIAIGPGIGTQPGTKKLVEKIVTDSNIPMVIDADAINCIAGNTSVLDRKKAPAVLTPHPGEMARLCSVTTEMVQDDRPGIASQFAKDHNVIVVLKGARTIISFPDGACHICPTGNPGMASGGMGDVLTGMIAAFHAQGFSLENASLAAVYIHGLAADILSHETGAFGFIANDLVSIIPQTIHKHLK